MAQNGYKTGRMSEAIFKESIRAQVVQEANSSDTKLDLLLWKPMKPGKVSGEKNLIEF